MAFTGIESSERGGGGVALICSEWLTLRKRHCFWPPIKSSVQFEKALIKRMPINEQDWMQYEVSRCFFETDDFHKAKKILKKQNLHQRWLVMKTRMKLITQSREKEVWFLMVNIEFAAVQSISFVNKSTLSFIINEYDSDDILSKDKLLKLLLFLKEQNTQILKELKILNSKPNTQRHQSFEPPLDIPIGLPLRTVEDVVSLEKYLSNGANLSALVSYLSTLGGRDFTHKTNIILRSLLTNEVAQLYSYRGTRLGKRALSTLNLKTVVVRAVQTGCSATENDVCFNIKVWLKHAKQRSELENKRQK
ncbi:hypothetical protein FQA39_LY17073 [Lamprigera yunnana]|nr:hypothetical protein FQA39_LY17073 [Lamprigera yunnana]